MSPFNIFYFRFKISAIFLCQCFFIGSSFPILAQSGETADNLKSGAKIYSSICKGCHEVSIAPSLRGVIGRPIASDKSYTSYSSALKEKQHLIWTPDNLDKFLSNPANFAPGTDMVISIEDRQKRLNIITFLTALSTQRK